MHPLVLFWHILKGKWTPPEDTKPDMTGRTVIVTGANVGLGYEAAIKFVQLGAKKVILACRTVSKGEDAAKKIVQMTQRKGVVEVWQLDMMDYESIRAFAKRAAELDHLDIAILNAGVSKLKFGTSKYGWEETLQVNVLSTAYLGMLLIPKLKASKTHDHTPVLEIVGSGMHLTVNTLKSETSILPTYNEKKNYNGIDQYGVSKLLVMYVQAHLAPLMSSAAGTHESYITVVCPGATKSTLARDADGWLLKAAVNLFALLVQKTTEQGARSYVSGVDLGEKGHGKFWVDDQMEMVGPLVEGEKGKLLGDRVWEEVLTALERDVSNVRSLAATGV